MGTCAAEVCASVTASSQNRLVCSESVKGAIFHVQGHDTNTCTVLHDQIERKVLDEEVRIMSKGLAIKRVKKSMPCAVGGGGAAICLASLAVFERLSTEGSLIYFAFLRSGKRYAEMLKLRNASVVRLERASYPQRIPL